jgi:hypothetical protein
MPLTIYIAGGAASVLEAARKHTHDIDFWTKNEHGVNKYELVEDAVKARVDGTDLNVGVPLMNAQIWVSATSPAFKNALKRSDEQNVIYYRGHGLVAFAYDYGFLLVTKLDKMSKGPEREIDVIDAVHFLSRYRQKHGSMTVDDLKVLYPPIHDVPEISDRSIERLIEGWRRKYQNSSQKEPFLL